MSLLKIVGAKLPPSQRSSLEMTGQTTFLAKRSCIDDADNDNDDDDDAAAAAADYDAFNAGYLAGTCP